MPQRSLNSWGATGVGDICADAQHKKVHRILGWFRYPRPLPDPVLVVVKKMPRIPRIRGPLVVSDLSEKSPSHMGFS